jgi:hypothetical protein
VASNYTNPLSDEHAKALDRVLESITPALELAQQCTDCGWDMSEYIAELKRQQQQATLAKQRFFPMRS